MAIERPLLYAALLNNQNDHTANFPAGTWFERIEVFGLVCTWVESNNPDIISAARALPLQQCVDAGERQNLMMNWLLCDERFRVLVRPEHLQALVNATSLAEFEEARGTMVAECGYPPAAP